MSAAPADESSEMSLSVGYLIGKVIIPEFDQLSEETQRLFAEKIDFPVRKCAHFTEYTILGILLYTDTSLLFPIRFPSRRIAISFLCGMLYACTDEYHQLFVAGRSGQWTDVMIDSSGVFLGGMICLTFVLLWKKRKQSIRLTARKKTA